MADPLYDKYSINCWSGPRCCSTSLMYAFAQRSDTQVLDEPLYASYLRLTGLARPYRDQVLASQENDGNKVVADQILGPRSKQVLYAKHIAKQKMGLQPTIWSRANHVILVREPYGVVQSFSKVLSPTLQELGYASLAEIYSELRAQGRPPVVILADDLVRAPEAVLRALCAALDLPWQASMLHWAPGPKPYDGVWAPWWYASTHKSTGFDPVYRDSKEPLPDRLKPLLAECWAAYDLLRAHALRPDALGAQIGPPGPSTAGGPLSKQGSLARGSVAAAGAAAAEAAAAGISGGSHAHPPDPRNADVLVGVRDGVLDTFDLMWRPQARVSVLDSGFMLGDGVWEGLRVHRGVVVLAGQHLDRLFEGAKALDMDPAITKQGLLNLVYQTLDANGMGAATGVHIRLMMTRGLKSKPYQDPRCTVGRPTIVVLPEWKETPGEGQGGPREKGLRLFTVHVRRGAPDVQDPGLNSHSKINCITACIQATKAGCDEALMLDPNGFVCTCNSTNFIIVRKGEVWAPRGGHMMRGITRDMVLALAAEEGMTVRELDFSVAQVYGADEAMCTGTMAGVLPVVEVDGRVIGSGARGPVTLRMQALYAQLLDREAAAGRGAALDDEDPNGGAPQQGVRRMS